MAKIRAKQFIIKVGDYKQFAAALQELAEGKYIYQSKDEPKLPSQFRGYCRRYRIEERNQILAEVVIESKYEDLLQKWLIFHQKNRFFPLSILKAGQVSIPVSEESTVMESQRKEELPSFLTNDIQTPKLEPSFFESFKEKRNEPSFNSSKSTEKSKEKEKPLLLSPLELQKHHDHTISRDEPLPPIIQLHMQHLEQENRRLLEENKRIRHDLEFSRQQNARYSSQITILDERNYKLQQQLQILQQNQIEKLLLENEYLRDRLSSPRRNSH